MRVKDILAALDSITGGRCVKLASDYASGNNPFVLTRTSNIPGKAVTELPGLVWGDPEMGVKKAAIMMTMTESAIELAAATGVDALIAHHPVADAANSGGTLIRTYMGLYHMAVFELHEAFHGLHGGGAFLHGHTPIFRDIDFGGIRGNVVYVGDIFPEIHTARDWMERLETLMDTEADMRMLEKEQEIRGVQGLQETSVAARCALLAGEPETPIKRAIHMFPHAGFQPEHIDMLLDMFPDIDTLIAVSSRVDAEHPIAQKARSKGLAFLCGNSHALEVFENGLPLAKALKQRLPGLEIVIFRERMVSVPESEFGSGAIQKYARDMADQFLL